MNNKDTITQLNEPASTTTTFSTILAGIVFTTACATALRVDTPIVRDLTGISYIHQKSNDSYDSYINPHNGEPYISSDEFTAEITSLFLKLNTSQQHLDKKFENILFDNLWNLYEE